MNKLRVMRMAVAGLMILCLMLSLACLVGCGSGIKVSKVENETTELVGVPWNLSMTQFEVEITRQIVDCTPENIKINVEASVIPKKVLDYNHRYVLYSSGWWATSDIKSEMDANGTSIGLNAGSNDKTAAVASNVIEIAKNVAVGFLPISSSIESFNDSSKMIPLNDKNITLSIFDGQKGNNRRETVCNSNVQNAIYALTPREKGGGGLTEEVEVLTGLYNSTVNKVVLYRDLLEDDDSYKKELDDLLMASDNLQKALMNKQNILLEDIILTTHVQTVLWPLKSDDFSTKVNEAFKVDEAVLKEKWLRKDSNEGYVDATIENPDVHLALYHQGASGSWEKGKLHGTDDITEGVPVRLGSPGRLLVCIGEECDDSYPANWNAAEDEKVMAFNHPILQLGPMYTVPATGGAFKSEKAVIEMDKVGVPTSIQVVEQKAAMEELTGMFKQVSALPQQIQQGVTEKIQNQLQRAQAQKEVNTIRAELATSEQISALKAMETLLESQRSLEDAMAALRRTRMGM